jgi:hypothetical protein
MVRIYFDDIAVWTKSKIGKFIKIGVCSGLVIATVVSLAGVFIKGNQYKAQIQENEVIIADTEAQLAKIKEDIEHFETVEKTVTYSAFGKQGPYVASKQTEYDKIIGTVNSFYLQSRLKEVADGLVGYIDTNYGPWYPTKEGVYKGYQWSYMTRLASLIKTIPSVWVCSIGGNNMDLNSVAAVTTAVYDYDTECFTDLKTYITYYGRGAGYGFAGSVFDEDCNIALSGQFSPQYVAFVDKVGEILDAKKAAENLHGGEN